MTRKILILVPNDNLGGAEQHLRNIALYYLEKGYFLEVRFLTKERTNSWRNLGENCRLIFTDSSSEKSGIAAFFRGIIASRNTSYDFLYTSHVHLTGIAGLLINLNLLKVRKFVGRESTSIFKRFTGPKLWMFKAFYKIGYNRLDLLICQTAYMKRQLIEGLPKLGKRINIQVIPNPINLNKIKTEVPDFYLKNRNYIISAGRLIPEKGFDILIRAFVSLIDKFPEMTLIVLGEGEERDRLEALVDELGVNEKVFLIGFKDNVYNYFKYAKSCVVSSRIEGFPNVLLQMMSQNDSVVSTLCAGGIEDIPSIYTCEPNDVDKLAIQIEASLINDNSFNREVFDNFLEKRSVPNFVEQINTLLNV